MTESPVTRQRLSRDDQRRQTIERLCAAGVELFARDGIAETSIEQISEAAGYSRGAFYSNFVDKDAFVQHLIERSHREQQRDNEALLESSSPAEFVERLADRSRTTSSAVGIEYVLHAIRRPESRDALRQLIDTVLADHASIVAQQFDRLDSVPPLSPIEAARILLVLDHGAGLLGLLDPVGFPSEFWGDTVEFFNEAVGALVEKREREAGTAT